MLKSRNKPRKFNIGDRVKAAKALTALTQTRYGTELTVAANEGDQGRVTQLLRHGHLAIYWFKSHATVKHHEDDLTSE